MMLGLRTAIYHVPDLAKAKAWYRDAFGVMPYFDAPYYVGFNIGGFELGLNPDTKTIAPGARGVVAYWGVVDVNGTVDNSRAWVGRCSSRRATWAMASSWQPSPIRSATRSG